MIVVPVLKEDTAIVTHTCEKRQLEPISVKCRLQTSEARGKMQTEDQGQNVDCRLS